MIIDRKAVMLRVCSTLGTFGLIIGPWIIDSDIGKMIMIMGLAFLSFQAYNLRAWNLIFLNLIGIMGYAYAIYI